MSEHKPLTKELLVRHIDDCDGCFFVQKGYGDLLLLDDVRSAVMGMWEASGRMAPVRIWFPVFFDEEDDDV